MSRTESPRASISIARILKPLRVTLEMLPNGRAERLIPPGNLGRRIVHPPLGRFQPSWAIPISVALARLRASPLSIRTAILSHSLRRNSLFRNYAKPIDQRSILHPEFLSSIWLCSILEIPLLRPQRCHGRHARVLVHPGGFLYEVATYKELEPWLAEIMSTWKFL